MRFDILTLLQSSQTSIIWLKRDRGSILPFYRLGLRQRGRKRVGGVSIGPRYIEHASNCWSGRDLSPQSEEYVIISGATPARPHPSPSDRPNGAGGVTPSFDARVRMLSSRVSLINSISPPALLAGILENLSISRYKSRLPRVALLHAHSRPLKEIFRRLLNLSEQ